MFLDHHKIFRNQFKSDILQTEGYFRVWKFSFQDRGFHKIAKKIHVERFFQFLMLNISSIKELLHKPSEIQWNITGTLPGKLKRKFRGLLTYKILPLEIIKTGEIAILGGTLGAWEPMWNSMVFYDFVNFWKFQPLSFG